MGRVVLGQKSASAEPATQHCLSRAGAVVGRAKRGDAIHFPNGFLNYRETTHQTSGLLSLKDNLGVVPGYRTGTMR